MNCPSCAKEVMDIDVRCMHCGTPLGATGAHRMLGSVVLGVYELVDVLGQGGMSVVFKGKHKMTEQEVALKILPPELAAHSQVKSRFLEEAKALAALDHPNIVHLYNFGQENGFFVLAMQYVQGKTWERMILEKKYLDWRASCRIAVDVLRALEYAHGRGVVHRDMKPSNVLVRESDGAATVMDFGIAKMTTSTKLTATGQTMGTVRYMSPEQVRGHEVDARTDIYSLGATLYESLTGDTPFDGSTHFEIMTKHLSDQPRRPSTLGIEVPQLVEDAVMRSLAKKTDDRFPDAREMRKQLEAALREGDLGLTETAKLNREVLGDLRPTSPAASAKAAQTPVRLATASDLADQLEPGMTGATPKRRRRSAMPWVILGAVTVAGAAAVTLVMLNKRPQGYQPLVTDIEGVKPVAGANLGKVRLETAGTTQPADLADYYQRSLGALRAKMAAKGLELADPVDVVIAVPPKAMCDERAYHGRKMRFDCSSHPAFAVLAPRGQRRLMVVDDPARLSKAFEIGVADAVCIFDPDDAKCEIAKELLPKAPE